MVLETLVFVGAAIGTLVVGAPIVSAITRQHTWRTPTVRDATQRKQREVVRAFAPLDLGPDPVRWPSERLWELKSTLGVPDWPSRSWNDEHFGRHWKEGTSPVHDDSERGFHAMASRRHREEGEVTTAPVRPVAQRRQSRQRAAQAGAVEPQRQEPQRQQETPPPVRKAPTQVAAAAVAAKAKPPDEAEIEHLIAAVGLAGTVQAIMQRTGWEFRDAAQYLARIRRNP